MDNNSLVRLEANYRNLDRVNGWIANAEAKAGALLTASGILLGFASLRIAEEVKPIIKGGGPLQTFAAIIFILYVLTFLASLVHSTLVLLPRVQSPHPSLFFFGSIAELPLADFVTQMRVLTVEQIESELISQTHTNAIIASKKFDHVRAGFGFFVVSLGLGIIFLVLKGFGG